MPPTLSPAADFAALSSKAQETVNFIRLAMSMDPLDENGAPLPALGAGEEEDEDGPPRKRAKSSIYDDDKDLYTSAISSGHFYAIACNPFNNFKKAARHGAVAKWGKPASVARLCNSPKNKMKHERRAKEFNVWFDHLTSYNPEHAFDEVLAYLFLHCRKKIWDPLVEKIKKAAESERDSIVHELKFAFSYWIPNHAANPPQILSPALSSSDESKATRGVTHPVSLSNLLPCAERRLLPDLTYSAADSDPDREISDEGKDLLTRIGNRKYTLDNSEFPSFLYADWTIVVPGQRKVGLFRGFLVLRVLRHIWISRKFAITGLAEDAGIPGACAARRHRVSNVTPRMLGIAICHARTMLSSSSWMQKDGDYDYLEMFNKIVDVLESEKESVVVWAKETLEFVDKSIYNANEALAFEDAVTRIADASEDLLSEFDWLIRFDNTLATALIQWYVTTYASVRPLTLCPDSPLHEMNRYCYEQTTVRLETAFTRCRCIQDCADPHAPTLPRLCFPSLHSRAERRRSTYEAQ
ncbi:hypothetical protein MKEN_00839000 [Mycena kentingensis (nom. inval.)]|nr:hypothetical protein MKEN_00839000 [Mycena kentingensis (nom. inval.)]